MDPSQLTFLAEALGTVDLEFQRTALKFLSEWINHKSALVREGAVYGLDGLMEDREDKVLEILKDRLDKEDSPGVKAAIRDALGLEDG